MLAPLAANEVNGDLWDYLQVTTFPASFNLPAEVHDLC